MLNRGASAAAGNQYDKLETGRVPRPTSDEYLKPDEYDYIVDPQDAANTVGVTGNRVVYYK